MTERPPVAQLLENPDAVLFRTDLRYLGWGRNAIDAIFRAAEVVALPGFSRPAILVKTYLALIEEHTYRDDRVRPT